MSNNYHDHLADNDDAEDIELVGGGSLRRRHALPPPLPSCPVLFDSILLLFLIALIVGYKLGMEEGKAEVQHDWMNGAMIESNSKELQEIHEALNSLALELQQVIDHEDSTPQIQNETEALETTTTTTTSPSP